MRSHVIALLVIVAVEFVSSQQFCQTPGVQYHQLPGYCNYYIRCFSSQPVFQQCPGTAVFSAKTERCVNPCDVNDDCSTTCSTNYTGTVQRVNGPLSTSDHEAISDVTCPAGSYVLNCDCSQPETCHGTVIINGTRCLAFNGRQGSGQQALGVCLFDVLGKLTTSRSPLSPSPEAVCPAAFRVIACAMYYGGSDFQARVRPSLNTGRNSCQTSAVCQYEGGCLVQAVCQRT